MQKHQKKKEKKLFSKLKYNFKKKVRSYSLQLMES